jgi:hypothetical protein
MAMLAFIATPSLEFVARQEAVRTSWTIAERKQRAVVAQLKQQELGRCEFCETKTLVQKKVVTGTRTVYGARRL